MLLLLLEQCQALQMNQGYKKGDKMTLAELAQKIYEILPNAVFGEENANGEILIATGLVENKDGTLSDLDD